MIKQLVKLSRQPFVFRAALKYLGCTELSTLNVEEQRSKAYILAVAALLGKDVYNFGELLAHPGENKVHL
jgi:26S proteasome regulatory subunit N9